MTQLDLLSFTPPELPAPPGPSPIFAHQVRVPVDTRERRDNAERLFKIIKRLYDETGRDGSFHDFVTVVLGVLHRFEDGDASYMDAIKGMSPKAVSICAEGWSILVEHFWHEGCFYDILGDVYMQVSGAWAKSRMGQYFTPWHVCKMMCVMTLGEPDWDSLENGPGIEINEPACGSGAILLAAKAHIVDLAKDDPDPRRFLRRVRLYGQDIDRVCVDMARIQLTMSDDRWMTNFMLATYSELAINNERVG